MTDEYRDEVAIVCGFNRTPQESELSATERQLFNCAALAIHDRDIARARVAELAAENASLKLTWDEWFRGLRDQILGKDRFCPACGWDHPEHSPQCRYFDPHN